MGSRRITGVFDTNGNMIKEGSIVSDGYLNWEIVWEDAAFRIRELGETATAPFTEDMVDTLDLFVVPTARTDDRN